jgi:ATP-binding cassette subfamily B protein
MNYETVKTFGAEARAAATYDQALAGYSKASIQANTSLALLNGVQGLVMNIGLGVMAVLAGVEAMAGRMGPGDVTAAILILISLYAPLNILGFAYREIRQSFIDMEAMLDLTRQKPDVADAPDAIDLPGALDRRGGDIVFKGVSFRHDARSEGLSDVSFQIAAGESLGLVGESGSGKSTISRLVCRLIDASEGQILFDGQSIGDQPARELRLPSVLRKYRRPVLYLVARIGEGRHPWVLQPSPKERLVRQDARVQCEAKGLSVPVPRAHGLVGGIGCLAARVAYAR